jgi:hypothetical protein
MFILSPTNRPLYNDPPIVTVLLSLAVPPEPVHVRLNCVFFEIAPVETLDPDVPDKLVAGLVAGLEVMLQLFALVELHVNLTVSPLATTVLSTDKVAVGGWTQDIFGTFNI